ncbi:MAG: tetraacyldisaccharide 4'-kinase [Gammaproteobacteria bacterium]|nr:tetraacyldisaccharide 4'-kinase [Gammaproteobacteria bacterium]
MKPITYYWQSLNFVSLALAPISFLFCLLVSIRHFLYRIRLFKSNSSKLPVIVVGNIYIGGNGKTPFVIWLVEQLKEAGFKPGVVSRGYGAEEGNEKGAAWPRQVDLKQDILLFGDEPFLIHKTTMCPVIIDPIRSRAVEKIAQDTDCDIIISDDGLQHYAMSRFIEINITDAKRLYGNKLCLPAGPLRERLSRLSSVDYIVYNISREPLENSDKELDKNEFLMDYEVSNLEPLSVPSMDDEKQSMTLTDFKGKIVHAVAGIGAPESFFKLLQKHGINVIEHPFTDHYQYQPEDLVFDQPYPIIMTEKDAVKCQAFFKPGLLFEEPLTNVWFLPIKASVNSELTKKILKQLKEY